MEKINISFKLLLLFVLIAFVFSTGVYFLYSPLFKIALGTSLIIAVFLIVAFLTIAGVKK